MGIGLFGLFFLAWCQMFLFVWHHAVVPLSISSGMSFVSHSP